MEGTQEKSMQNLSLLSLILLKNKIDVTFFLLKVDLWQTIRSDKCLHPVKSKSYLSLLSTSYYLPQCVICLQHMAEEL